jgi:hypothetical protein
MGFSRAIVVTAGALILLSAQAQPVSASDGNGGLARPRSAASFAAAASSVRFAAAPSLTITRGDSKAAVQTVAFVTTAGVGGGACGSGACTDQTARDVVNAPAAPTPSNHVLLLAAVGAVAFMASRRHIGS